MSDNPYSRDDHSFCAVEEYYAFGMKGNLQPYEERKELPVQKLRLRLYVGSTTLVSKGGLFTPYLVFNMGSFEDHSDVASFYNGYDKDNGIFMYNDGDEIDEDLYKPLVVIPITTVIRIIKKDARDDGDRNCVMAWRILQTFQEFYPEVNECVLFAF